MQSIPMTVRGADLLRKELNELKTVTRPKIIADIAVAREHGDLKENAEYHSAREQQGFCEGRIQDLKVLLQFLEYLFCELLLIYSSLEFSHRPNEIPIYREERSVLIRAQQQTVCAEE
jgi:hypothetical protein